MLHVHRSERADGLVEALAAVLADPPDDPMAHEVIAVPAKGVERWLMQRLSHSLGARPGHNDGICANVDFPHPSRLVAETLAAASGIDGDNDPWRRKALIWTLLDVIDDCVGEPWCATLTSHLGVGDATHAYRRNRRLATAQHLAQLYDSYGENRPEMLRDWAQGSDTDGAGGSVPHDLKWQPELWRRLAQRIGTDSPAQRLPAALDRIRSDADNVELPATAVGLRTHPAHDVAAAGPGSDSRRPRRPPLAAASLRTALGRDRRAANPERRRYAATATPRSRRRATRCWPAWAATPASCSSSWQQRQTNRPITTTPSNPDPTPSSADSNKPYRTTMTRPTPRTSTSSTPRTTASPSTPATARRARSRSCGRCSSGCSPMIRPSSRATCSSCAPTSRTTRR